MTGLPVFTAAVTLSGALLLAGQALPEGRGKELIATRCSGCHGIETVTGQRLDRDAWTPIVAKMIEKGARLDEQERDIALTYLATHFGPAPKPAVDPEVERTARRYIDGICSSCHGSDLVAGTRGTKDAWLDIVKRMNGKGAGLSEADVELLADYLARTYPAE